MSVLKSAAPKESASICCRSISAAAAIATVAPTDSVNSAMRTQPPSLTAPKSGFLKARPAHGFEPAARRDRTARLGNALKTERPAAGRAPPQPRRRRTAWRDGSAAAPWSRSASPAAPSPRSVRSDSRQRVRLSTGCISQLRRELHASWRQFCGESAPASAGAAVI